MTDPKKVTAEQTAQHISDDFMLDLDGRVALAHAIKTALTLAAQEAREEALLICHCDKCVRISEGDSTPSRSSQAESRSKPQGVGVGPQDQKEPLLPENLRQA